VNVPAIPAAMIAILNGSVLSIHGFSTYVPTRSHPTVAFSCGARSAFKLRGKRLLEKHAIVPSAARLC
jgi:hypothetical protein